MLHGTMPLGACASTRSVGGICWLAAATHVDLDIADFEVQAVPAAVHGEDCGMEAGAEAGVPDGASLQLAVVGHHGLDQEALRDSRGASRWTRGSHPRVAEADLAAHATVALVACRFGNMHVRL